MEALVDHLKPADIPSLLKNLGTVTASRVKLLELSDGGVLDLPILVKAGRHPGEVVYIGAGIHGTEVNGVSAAIAAVKNIAPNDLHGSIVLVPVQNPLGFRERTRLIEFEHQVDAEVLNLHRLFPGDSGGSPIERIAAVLFDIMQASEATFHFDLHTGHRGAETAAHTFIGPLDLGKPVEEALEAAHYVDADFIVGERSAGSDVIYARPGMHHVALSRLGVPVLGAELGAGGVSSPRMIEIGRQGILNVLRHRGVLRDGIEPDRYERPLITKVEVVRANRGGLYSPLVGPGALVERGQVIATISDPYGEVIESVESPVHGYVTTLTTYPALHEGERICRIGVPQ